MLIEHKFVTTLDAPGTFALACSFLRETGFTVSNQAPFQADLTGDQPLEMTRGAGRHADPKRCFQSVHLEFDRGRVKVAASILPAGRGSFGLTISSVDGGEPGPRSRWGRPYAELMVALANTLESLLARGQSPAEAGRSWLTIEDALSRRVQSAKNSGIVKGVAALALLCMVMVGLILSSINNSQVNAEQITPSPAPKVIYVAAPHVPARPPSIVPMRSPHRPF